MSNVVDLLSRRQARRESALHFATAPDALAFASQQVRDLQHLAGTRLLVNAEELDLPLAQLAAVLDACLVLHAGLPHQEGSR